MRLPVLVGIVALGLLVGCPKAATPKPAAPRITPEGAVVYIKRRVEPRYPAGPDDGDARCAVKISVGEDGAPTDVEVSECAEVFAAETRLVLMKWLWYPPELDGAPVAATIEMHVNYVQSHGPEGP